MDRLAYVNSVYLAITNNSKNYWEELDYYINNCFKVVLTSVLTNYVMFYISFFIFCIYNSSGRVGVLTKFVNHFGFVRFQTL